MLVPYGSGAASWEDFHIHLEDPAIHQFLGPTSVLPSAIFLQVCTEHITDHPSGAYIRPKLTYHLDGEIKYWYGEVLIPSGEKTVYKIGPVIPDNATFESGRWPLYGDDVLESDVNLRVYYNDESTYYQSDLRIHSVNTVIEAWSIAETGNNYLPFITVGAQNSKH